MRFLLLAAICVGQVFADATAMRLFWTDKDERKIESSDVDGGNRVTILSNLVDPRGIAVDASADKIYWASHVEDGAIYRANCDGSDAEVFIDSLSEPADLVIDLENRFIYWVAEADAESDRAGDLLGRIQRADLDGSRDVTTIVGGLDRPYYLALDSGFIYWSYFNSSVIERALIAGGGRSVIISGQLRVRDIEISDGVIYWCDRNSNQLRSREIDGASEDTVLFTGGLLDRPHGLVLDPMSNTMYWTDTETSLIGSSAMDGSGTTRSLVTSDLNGPWAIDLVIPLVEGDPYKSWQVDQFADEDLNDPTKEASVWGSNADPDRDGSPNILEYAQGSDPNSGVVGTGLMVSTSGEKFQIVLRMRADDIRLNFDLESAADLESAPWTDGLFQEVGMPQVDPNDIAYEFITMETDASDVRLFARIRIWRAE